MGTKFLANKMSQNVDSGTSSQLSKYKTTSDASDTMNFWNNRVNICDQLSLIAQDILAAPCKSGVRWNRVFCVWPAYYFLLLVAETE